MMESFRTLISAGGIAAATILQTFSPFSASAQDDLRGFSYCAPPYPPKCARASFARKEAAAACGAEVDSYVAAVFSYRACLAREMERAVLEANRMVQILKCPKDKRFCYGLPPSGTP